MPIVFSTDQRKVIDTRNCNILVSAAAGSGKTAVLVERIVTRICDPKDPMDVDRLLVVTFTKAAAAEMKERLAARLAEKMAEEPDSEHLQKQMSLLHNAQITTIDSFSLYLVKNHFNEIGLDPAFRVADPNELELIKRDVMAEFFEDMYASEDGNWQRLVDYFCPTGNENDLEEGILKVAKFADSFPWPTDWLNARRQDYEISTLEELEKSDYIKYLKVYIDTVLQGCLNHVDRAQKLCELPAGPYMYGDALENDKEQIEGIMKIKEFFPLCQAVKSIEYATLSRKRDDSVSTELKDRVKKVRQKMKDGISDLDKIVPSDAEEILEENRNVAEYVNLLIDAVLEFSRRLEKAKMDKKIITFSDMEHFALQILTDTSEGVGNYKPSQVALEYRKYFKEIMTDEYQDSNMLQEYILSIISGEEDGNFNRFMVGDVKQSIYMFRMARPQLFMEKYRDYQPEGDHTLITLSKNFRSRDQVVRGVNEVMGRIMSEQAGGVVYDEDAALHTGADYTKSMEADSYATELILIDNEKKTSGYDDKDVEATVVARKIKEMHGSFMVYDKDAKELRPMEYSDCVILLRTNSGWDDKFKKALEAEGIPAYVTTKTGYFKTTEIQAVLQLLRTIDNPRQDIALFGTMKSVFGGFTDAEVASLHAMNKKASIYSIMRAIESASRECSEGDAASRLAYINAIVSNINDNTNNSQNDASLPVKETLLTGGLVEKITAFLNMLDSYREMVVYLPIRELLQRIFDEHDYLDYVEALPLGDRRRSNVEMLLTIASDYEKTSYFGLFHFVRYMELLDKYEVDQGEADTVDEKADVVRIMSIHKSKGLEFPVVILAGMSKNFNDKDSSEKQVLDVDLGLGIDRVDLDLRVVKDTLRKKIMGVKMKSDIRSEELRLLYVAMTRAKEKLIMTGVIKNAQGELEKSLEDSQDKVEYGEFLGCKTYLSWIMPILKNCGLQTTVVNSADIQVARLEGKVKDYSRRLALDDREAISQKADREDLASLRERLAHSYSHENLRDLYTKTTVSELKIAAMCDSDEAAFHAFEDREKEMVPYIPDFKTKEKQIDGAVRGDAYHRSMEILDFDIVLGQFADIPEDYEEYSSKLDIKQLSQALHGYLVSKVEDLRLEALYLEAVNENKIINFLKTELAFRMWKAERRGELYREQPFVLGLSAARVNPEYPSEETVMIQGIIDVFFVENGKIVLLDYKTDVIESLESLHNRYETQLDYYCEAIQRLMKMKVKERILYSFNLEQYG